LNLNRQRFHTNDSRVIQSPADPRRQDRRHLRRSDAQGLRRVTRPRVPRRHVHTDLQCREKPVRGRAIPSSPAMRRRLALGEARV